MINLNIQRFRQLALDGGALWQGGVFRIPSWAMEESGQPDRPLIAFWISATDGHLAAPRFVEDENPMQCALDALLDFAMGENGVGSRPSLIEVNDEQLAEFLNNKLSGAGVRVKCVKEIPVLDACLDDLCKYVNQRKEPPGPFSGKGVGIEHMRSFAQAADAFYRAQPWQELSDEDLIIVEKPKAPRGLGYISVLGFGQEAYGLGFFADVKQYQRMQAAPSPDQFLGRDGVWSLTFCDITQLPFADADLWKDHKLPVADQEAFPYVCWFGPNAQIRRPDAAKLAFIEGLLTALAQTTPSQLDQGQWSNRIRAGGKSVTYKLALVQDNRPDGALDHAEGEQDVQLLRREMERGLAEIERLMQGHDFDSMDDVNACIDAHLNAGNTAPSLPKTPLGQAQEIVYQARSEHGRRRRRLAQQAIEMCPDCADAYVLLAEEAGDVKQACEMYCQAMQAGERVLGPEIFREEEGNFWGIVETRPYMRARAGLADCLCAMDRKEEAAAHYEALLLLNPNDNQGLRYLLAGCYLELGNDDRLGELLALYDEEDSAQWLYLKALWTYRKAGDSKEARKRIRKAIKNNRFVPPLLTGERRLPERLPDCYHPGEEDEALICASTMRVGWKATPGSVDWLIKMQHSHR